MIKTVIFDYDRSLASIGSDETVTELFGLPAIPIFNGLSETRRILRKLVAPSKRTFRNPLFGGEEVIQEGFDLSPRAKELGIECIVFDSITCLGLQEREAIVQKRKLSQLDQKGWGEYGRNLTKFIYNMATLPCKLIMMAHVDRERDADGESIEIPALKGSAKNEVQRWFDIILYAHTYPDKKQGTVFSWQTKPTEGRFAKDRLNVLPDVMEQDFSEIFRSYEEAGIKYPKILVIGESGSGKSYSLVSINQGEVQTKSTFT